MIWILFGMFAAGALFGVLFMALLSVAREPDGCPDRRREPVNARPETVGERV